MGMMLPTIFYDDIITDKDKFISQTNTYLWANAYLTTSLCTLVLFLMREKPKHPPSNSQFHKEVPAFKESLKMMWKNKSFLC